MDTQTPSERALSRHIKRTLRLTFVGLLLERFVQAFLWFGVLVAFILAAVLFGVFSALGGVTWIVSVAVCVVALGVCFGACAKRFRMPNMLEARDRVDGSVPHRPLQALDDLTATGHENPQTQQIWQAHQDRMAQRALAVRAMGPNIRLAGRDPFALRLIAITTLVMGLLFGTGGLRFEGVGSANAIAAGPSWEGWIEPPAHTGKPTLYLADMPDRFTAPLNSKVTIRLYGDEDALQMRQTVSDTADLGQPLAQDFTLQHTGEIEIKGDTGRLWNVALLPDMPPLAELIDDMTRAASGELRQSFRLSDDFGIARAQFEIELDKNAVVPRYGYRVAPEARDGLVLSIPIPRAAKRQDFEGVVAENLSRHPFSGLPVRVRLKAWDVAGHETVSAQNQAILPGRKFFDPLAAALIDVRRELLWSRENTARAAQVIRAVSYAQDRSYGGDHALFLRLRSVAGAIETGGADMSKDVWDNVAETLWTIAVELEDGELSEALERLRRAQERLSQAMRDGATPDEIARLMQDLRDATQDYLRQRAEQQDQDADQDEAQNGESVDVSADQLQELMDRIQELMEQGRMAEAQQLMDMLNELLENMQVRREPGAGGQAIEGMEEMLREQQKLNDETFSDLQKQFGSETPEGSEQSPSGGAEGSLADRQQALRGQAQQQGRDLPSGAPDQGDDPASDLERAERSMEDAEQALRDEDYARALDNQARAMKALRDGLKNLNEQLSRSGEPQDGESSQAQSGQPSGQDPLGRSDGESQGTARSGNEGAGGPEQDDVYKQAEELLDEIRRRSAQRERADEELDYLKRLLDRF